MTAVIIPLASRRGRPSNARLAELQEQAQDAHDEITALTAEGLELALQLVALSRRAQSRVARGVSPADVLVEIEVLAIRHGNRLTAAAAALEADELCPDGADERHSGHGAAA